MQLPHGWSSCSLSDIAAVNPKTVADESLIAGFVPMSHAPTSYHGELLFDEKPWGEIKKSYTNFQDGDVIFAKVTPCFENGKAAIVDDLPNGIGAGSSEFYVLRPYCFDISQKLLFALIKTHAFMQEGATNMTGAVGLRRVPKSFVETFPIALPPAAEQKEIVDRLDILLAQVEATQARLARIPDIIKRFRRSVLIAAISGKLTDDLRDKNSIEATLNEIKKINVDRQALTKGKNIIPAPHLKSEEFDIPSSWRWVSLDFLTKKIVDGTHHTPTYINSGVPFISVKDIKNGGIDFKSVKYISYEEHEELSKRCNVEKGDLLITKSGTIGRTAIVNTDKEFSLFVSVALLKPVSDMVNIRFVDFVLQKWISEIDVSSRIVGTAVKNLHLRDMKVLAIPFAPLAEQTEIVRRVEQLFAYADRIEQQAKAAKARVDNLTQAILAKAFRGELTADWRAANPDLISGDHSAEALLARIQAERATAKPRKRASKPAISPTSSGVTQ